jgi:hypothetical protein
LAWTRERLKGNLDLLLSVLSSGPTHGYAIIAAQRESGGPPAAVKACWGLRPVDHLTYLTWQCLAGSER